jgi:hypothetical protein
MEFYNKMMMMMMKRKEYRWMVLEDRVLSRTFGSKRNGVTGDCRKINIKKLHSLYSLTSNIILSPQDTYDTLKLFNAGYA